MAKHKLTVSVDERLYALAHARKQRTGRTISEIVEQALWTWASMPIAEAIGIASIPLPGSPEVEQEDIDGRSAARMDVPKD